ncbi:MAG: hypothetical protein IKY67_05945 [Paludibacteraceae bacterium]|nr:hypothetical protein [Paludibacteraceae bacterium]
MKQDYYIIEIKNRVKMPDMLRHYGFKLNGKNRMPCPFHNGKDNNLGAKDEYFNCFVCDAKGDIFKFVQDYFGISFQDALLKLNDDFCIGLPIGKKLDRRKRLDIAKKAHKIRQEREHKEAERKAIADAYWDADAEYDRLERNLRQYAPKENLDNLHHLFVEAVYKLPFQKYVVECALLRWWEYEHRDS